MVLRVVKEGNGMKQVEWNGLLLDVPESVYEPREDSFLLAQHLPDCKGKTFLDMGCGSGIQSLAALQKGATEVTIVDRNKDALWAAEKNIQRNFPLAKVKTVASFLFDKVEKQPFDVIAFNPPYLPSEETNDIRVDGGERGREVLDRFLEELPNWLSKEGKAVILHSSFNEDEETQEQLKKLKLEFEVVASERFFFEELSVWHVWKKEVISR